MLSEIEWEANNCHTPCQKDNLFYHRVFPLSQKNTWERVCARHTQTLTPCELLIPFLSISHRYPTAFSKAAIIKPWFFTQVYTISDWQKKPLFLKEAQEHKKDTNSRRTRIDRDSLFATFEMCGVLYCTLRQPSTHTLQILTDTALVVHRVATAIFLFILWDSYTNRWSATTWHFLYFNYFVGLGHVG